MVKEIRVNKSAIENFTRIKLMKILGNYPKLKKNIDTEFLQRLYKIKGNM